MVQFSADVVSVPTETRFIRSSYIKDELTNLNSTYLFEPLKEDYLVGFESQRIYTKFE